jgi:hypothetical protein
MLKTEGKNRAKATRLTALCCAFLLAPVFHFASASGSDFERTYNPRGPAHIEISNVNGSIRVNAWDKPSVVIRASTRNPSMIEDRTSREDISVRVRTSLKPARAEFEVSAPASASLVLKNYIGDITVKGIKGHISVSSIGGDVRMVGVSSESLDVKITSGNIFFDGELHEGGSYSLQSMTGDIDVTLPKDSPFNLNARALSENINLGAFLAEFSGRSRSSNWFSGNHLRGGPRLSLTTYSGRILLHKK